MADYQKVTPIQLGQAAITAAYTTLYTVPANTRTYVKNIDVCNTTGGAVSVYIHLVPSAGSVGTGNAIYYATSIAANAVLHWQGVQIMNTGDTIQIKGSGTGCTITASGGEAV